MEDINRILSFVRQNLVPPRFFGCECDASVYVGFRLLSNSWKIVFGWFFVAFVIIFVIFSRH